MDGLVIKPKWADLILSGQKMWEIRGRLTHKRGTIGIIKSGSGKVFGTVELTDCIPCTVGRFMAYVEKHCIEDPKAAFHYNQAWAWAVKNPIIFPEPVPYNHPRGAVIWVKLPEGGEYERIIPNPSTSREYDQYGS